MEWSQSVRNSAHSLFFIGRELKMNFYHIIDEYKLKNLRLIREMLEMAIYDVSLRRYDPKATLTLMRICALLQIKEDISFLNQGLY